MKGKIIYFLRLIVEKLNKILIIVFVFTGIFMPFEVSRYVILVGSILILWNVELILAVILKDSERMREKMVFYVCVLIAYLLNIIDFCS